MRIDLFDGTNLCHWAWNHWIVVARKMSRSCNLKKCRSNVASKIMRSVIMCIPMSHKHFLSLGEDSTCCCHNRPRVMQQCYLIFIKGANVCQQSRGVHLSDILFHTVLKHFYIYKHAFNNALHVWLIPKNIVIVMLLQFPEDFLQAFHSYTLKKFCGI